MLGLSKKCIIFCLNSSETAGQPISVLILFLADVNTLDLELGERLYTCVVNTCVFLFRLFGGAVAALAIALPKACFVENELIDVDNVEELLSTEAFKVEFATHDNFLTLFLILSFTLYS